MRSHEARKAGTVAVTTSGARTPTYATQLPGEPVLDVAAPTPLGERCPGVARP